MQTLAAFLVPALLLVAAGLALFRRSNRALIAGEFFQRAKGQASLEEAPQVGWVGGRIFFRSIGGPWSWFQRAGWCEGENRGRFYLVLFAVMFLIVALLSTGAWFAAAIVAGAAIAILALAWRQGSVRRARLCAQVPGFIDGVIRGLEVGQTVDRAFQESAESLAEPLRDVVRRINRRVGLGESLGDALAFVARVHALHELHLLGFALLMNQRHGGRISEMLEDVVRIISVQQRLGRELRALTAETRFTALILILLPIIMAVYLIGMNPDYLLTLWEHDTGRLVLLFAVGMQVFGSILVWRLGSPPASRM